MELHSLKPIPFQERNVSWADLLLIWSGISLCVPSFIIGAVLIPTFSWYEAFSINFLGNLAVGCLIVLGGYFGTKTGLPAVMFGKYVFGERIGHLVPTACLIISTLGWFAVITAITGQALNEIVKQNTGLSNPLLFIVLSGMLNSYTAILGFHSIKKYSRLSVPVLVFFCLWIAVRLFNDHISKFEIDYVKTGEMSFWEGIDLVIGGYIAGALAASDFSRYTLSNRANWMGVLPGTFFVSFILGLLGMLLAAITGDWNPVKEIEQLGLGIPALIFIFLASWTTNYNLLYSAGLAATNILPDKQRWKNTLICGVVGTVLAVMGIETRLQDMLSLLALIFSPLLGVLLTDLFAVKRLIKKGQSLQLPPNVNIPAIVSVLAGLMAVKILPDYLGTSVVGIFSSSLCYLVLKIKFK